MAEIRAFSDDALRARAHLDALAAIVRVSMPGAVLQAFVLELRGLQELCKEPPQRDSFSRGIWAGYDHLLTEIITRITREPEPPIANLDALAKEPPGHA